MAGEEEGMNEGQRERVARKERGQSEAVEENRDENRTYAATSAQLLSDVGDMVLGELLETSRGRRVVPVGLRAKRNRSR